MAGNAKFISSGTRWGKGVTWGPGWGGPATGAGWGGPAKGASTGKRRADASALKPGCDKAKREAAAADRAKREAMADAALAVLIDLMDNAESDMLRLRAACRVMTIIEGPPRPMEG
jgi:hypothetical protein